MIRTSEKRKSLASLDESSESDSDEEDSDEDESDEESEGAFFVESVDTFNFGLLDFAACVSLLSLSLSSSESSSLERVLLDVDGGGDFTLEGCFGV